MAYTQLDPEHEGGRTYNIDWAVGNGAPCNRVDTMLVQALFHIFFYEQDGRFTRDWADPESGYYFTRPAGHDSIDIDGFIGPATRAHIAAFQQGLKELSLLDTIDYRLDPMRQSVNTMTTRTQVHYSIAWLNATCKNTAYQARNPQYDGLTEREDMPMQLRSALKTVKGLANQYRFRIR